MGTAVAYAYAMVPAGVPQNWGAFLASHLARILQDADWHQHCSLSPSWLYLSQWYAHHSKFTELPLTLQWTGEVMRQSPHCPPRNRRSTYREISTLESLTGDGMHGGPVPPVDFRAPCYWVNIGSLIPSVICRVLPCSLTLIFNRSAKSQTLLRPVDHPHTVRTVGDVQVLAPGCRAAVGYVLAAAQLPKPLRTSTTHCAKPTAMLFRGT